MSTSSDQTLYGNAGVVSSLKIPIFDGTDPSAYPAWELAMQSLLLSKGLSIPFKTEFWESVDQFRYAKKATDMIILTQTTLTEAQSTYGYVEGDMNLPFERRKLFDEDMKKLETKNSLAINFYQSYTKGRALSEVQAFVMPNDFKSLYFHMQDTYRGNKLHMCLAFVIAFIKIRDNQSKPAAKERFNDLFRVKNEYNVLMSVVAPAFGEDLDVFNLVYIKATKLWEFLV